MSDRNCIMVTLSQFTIKDRPGGYAGIIRDFRNTMRESHPHCWCHRLTNLPKMEPHDIEYLYFVVGNRLRWRALVLDYYRNVRLYDEGATRYLPTGNWVILTNVEPVPAAHRRAIRGFQGFRYTERLY